jgi:predicted dinucleotide-binding enzyme
VKIGVLGAGVMATALAGRFVEGGHDVMIGGRTPAKARAAAAALGARSGTLAEAAAFSDTLLLAVLYQGLDHTLSASGAYDGSIDGKVLIDCNNPVETERFTLVPYPEGSLAQHVAIRTGARVAKAFHLAEAGVWRVQTSYGGRPPVVPIAGDSLAKVRAAELVAAVGAVPVDVGGLEQASYLEATAAIVIRHLWGGADLSTTFQLVAADSPPHAVRPPTP